MADVAGPEERRRAPLRGVHRRRAVGFAQYQLTDKLVVFTHTEVDDKCEGMGVGSALARAALDDVRAEGTAQVLPRCPFIKGWIEHHPDYADLVYGAPQQHRPGLRHERPEHVDVVVVGAGLSGIGAAYRLQHRVPRPDLRRPRGARRDGRHLGPVPLPGRPLGLRHVHPRLPVQAVDGGRSRSPTAETILGYIHETAAEFGIEQHIRYRTKVRRRRLVDRARPLDAHAGDAGRVRAR